MSPIEPFDQKPLHPFARTKRVEWPSWRASRFRQAYQPIRQKMGFLMNYDSARKKRFKNAKRPVYIVMKGSGHWINKCLPVPSKLFMVEWPFRQAFIAWFALPMKGNFMETCENMHLEGVKAAKGPFDSFTRRQRMSRFDINNKDKRFSKSFCCCFRRQRMSRNKRRSIEPTGTCSKRHQEAKSVISVELNQLQKGKPCEWAWVRS